MSVMACLHQLSQRCDSSGKKTLLQFLTYACVLLPLGDLATVYRLTVKFFSAAQVVHEMSPHLLGARALVTHSVQSEVLNLSHDASEQRRSDFIGSEVCHWPQFSNARRETNVTNVQRFVGLCHLSRVYSNGARGYERTTDRGALHRCFTIEKLTDERPATEQSW